jgi:hypothetical protein
MLNDKNMLNLLIILNQSQIKLEIILKASGHNLKII